MKRIEKIAYIGVDLGGTNLKTALVNRSGKILQHRIARVRVEQGAESVLKKLLAQCRALVDSAAKLGLKVGAIGLGVAGKIDRDTARGTKLSLYRAPAIARVTASPVTSHGGDDPVCIHFANTAVASVGNEQGTGGVQGKAVNSIDVGADCRIDRGPAIARVVGSASRHCGNDVVR